VGLIERSWWKQKSERREKEKREKKQVHKGIFKNKQEGGGTRRVENVVKIVELSFIGEKGGSRP